MNTAQGKLTDARIQRTLAGCKRIKLYDGDNLQLHITASNGRYWRFKYHFGGKEKMMSFGAWPGVSVAEARQAKQAARAFLVRGMDPAAQLKQDRASAVERAFAVEEAIVEGFVRSAAQAVKAALKRCRYKSFQPLAQRLNVTEGTAELMTDVSERTYVGTLARLAHAMDCELKIELAPMASRARTKTRQTK